mmetsp:Transcript_26615/g.56240  ORF Transcript_26615/g.56240 Transcript_26615/m.56240 type:complete len:200 (-) Transcript_26615:729-1328(-)
MNIVPGLLSAGLRLVCKISVISFSNKATETTSCIVVCPFPISMCTPSKSIIFRSQSGPFPSNNSLINPVPTSGSTSKQNSHRPFNDESSVGRVEFGFSLSNCSSIAKFSSGVCSRACVDRVVFSLSLRSFISGVLFVNSIGGRFEAAMMIFSLESRASVSRHRPVATLTAAPATDSTFTGASSGTPSKSGKNSDVACTG